MKNSGINRVKSGLFILACLFVTATLYGQKTADFSGSWTFNEEKSKMGDGGQRMIAKNIYISQGENSITIDRMFNDQNGDERKMTETYTLDGRESVNPIFNTTKKSTAVWSEDKKSLIVSSRVVFNMNGEEIEIKTVETYSLGDDGKTLIISLQSVSPRGERQATLVYDKN